MVMVLSSVHLVLLDNDDVGGDDDGDGGDEGGDDDGDGDQLRDSGN